MKKISVLFYLIGLASCEQSFYFEEFKTFENNWTTNNSPSFTVKITDTQSPYQLFIDLRHPNTYGFQNLWVFMHTAAPQNKMLSDTLELTLAAPNGRWLGKSVSGDLIAHHIYIKKDVIFPDTGTYTFTFSHAMRQQSIPMHDFGFLIQKGTLQ